jgi:hypothetical protein
MDQNFNKKKQGSKIGQLDEPWICCLVGDFKYVQLNFFILFMDRVKHLVANDFI